MSGKAKGSRFERVTCVALSRWVTDGKRQDCFWRSSLSGGRSTVAFRRGEKLHRQAGDICAISPEGHDLTNLFYFELKHYRSLELGNALIGTGKIFKFWEDAAGKAAIYERKPVLIAKQNHFPTLMITARQFSKLFIYSRLNYKGLYALNVYLFDDLLKLNYSNFIKEVKEHGHVPRVRR